MSRWPLWVGLATVLCLVGGCGGGAKDLGRQKLNALEDAAGIVENVFTESAAPAAKPDLKRLGDQLRDLDKKIAELPADKRAELEKKYQPEFDKALMRIRNRQMRMNAIPGGRDAYNQLGIK